MSDEHESYSSLVAQHSSLRLANGIRALILPRPASPTFALQLLVRAGSRHDGAGHGLAHLVEHLVFRAPGGSRVDLFAAVESLGGEVGASTLRDYTTFELVVAAPDAGHALALLPALVRAPAADAASVRGEQQIVCRELRERAAPAAALWDLLLAALWGDDPLVHAPGGSTDAVLALTPEATTEFHARHYRAPGFVVAAAGSCSPGAVAAAVETGLGDLASQSMGEPAGARVEPCPPTAARPPRDLHAPAAGPMTYLAVGLAVAGLEHPDCAALRALDVALGRGGASRLARA